MTRIGLLFSILFFVRILHAQPPCDPPIVGTVSVSGPVCPGGTVRITFSLNGDDDDLDVTYILAGVTYMEDDMEDGFTIEYVAFSNTTVVLLLAEGDDGCVTVFNQTLPITVSTPFLSLNGNNPACGQNNGNILATTSNGIAPYQYSLNGGPFQPGGNFSGLPAGNYTVVVQDAIGCTAEQTVVLTAPGAPALTLSTQNPACGQNNGSITATGSGGSPPYQYSLNGGAFQPGIVFSGLGVGNYTLVVRDAANCTAEQTVALTAPGAPALTLSTQNPACGQNNGSITATGSGGSPPYQYSLNGGAFQPGVVFSGLGVGNYTLVVRDAANCTAEQTVALTAPGAPALTLSTQNPACGQNNGSITITGSGGTPPYQYSLNGGAFQPGVIFSGLGVGNYSIAIRDANACINIESAALSNPGANLPPAVVSANTLSGCKGTVFVLTGNLPSGATGKWDSDEVQPPVSGSPVWNLSNAPIGTTTVSWELSAPGCPGYSTAVIEVNVLPPPVANPDGVFNVPENGSAEAPVLLNDILALPVTAGILSGPAQGSAFLNTQNLLVYQPDATAEGLDTVVYEICYQDCTNECDTALVIFRNIRADDPCIITGDTSNVFTNGLTPNGDGRNDLLVFRVVSVEDCAINYAKSEIIIYNRWGDVVFEASPYQNDWGGKNRSGQDLPPGVYYFVLRITLDRIYSQFGSVLLIR